MFGMSLPEILIIAIIAVLFLGPDKLPEAMVSIAKFFKSFKKTVNDAKSSFESEIKIAELKQDAAKYKASLEQATNTVRKKLTFEELDEIKRKVSSSADSINQAINKPIETAINSINQPAPASKAEKLSQQHYSPANPSNEDQSRRSSWAKAQSAKPDIQNPTQEQNTQAKAKEAQDV